MLKPASAVSHACLRVVVAGKLSQRVHRALRPIGCKSETLDAMTKTRQVDPQIRDRLLPADRVLLHLYVGGEQGARARQAALALASHPERTPADSNEQLIYDRVLAPFNALRAIFDLEDHAPDAIEETPEKLARALLEALCDDSAGVQAPDIALVACDLRVQHGGLFKARERVRMAQMELLTGNAPSEPVRITGALDIALQQLALAGFPDMAR
jgi:hypothetical protein